MGDSRQWTRVTAIAGIAFIVLALPGAFLPGEPPAPDAPIADLRAFARDQRTPAILATYLGGLGNIAAVVFLAGLYRLLRRAEREEGVLALAAVLGAALAGAVDFVGKALYTAFVYSDRGDDTLRALYDAGNLTDIFVALPWALFFAAAGLVMARTGVVARWLGWVGLAEAVVLLVYAAGLGQREGAWAPGGVLTYVAYILSFLWILVASVLLLVRREADHPVMRPAPV